MAKIALYISIAFEGQGANTGLPITALFFQKVFNDPELQKRAQELGFCLQLVLRYLPNLATLVKDHRTAPLIVEDIGEQGIDPLFE